MLILRNIERRCENILDDTMYSDSILEMMASTWLLIIMMFLVLRWCLNTRRRAMASKKDTDTKENEDD